ncbi:MAG: hypothetical protein NTY01_09955 [Verrucomicrobia bacterium]|nr:hypothetical protein [Verrucomicrobiota bacterium]
MRKKKTSSWELPDELATKVLRIYPDHGDTYLWDVNSCATGADDELVGGSKKLDRRFRAWAHRWEQCCGLEAIGDDKATLAAEKFDEQGLALAGELKRVVGGSARVIYYYTLLKKDLEILEDGSYSECAHETDWREWVLKNAERMNWEAGMKKKNTSSARKPNEPVKYPPDWNKYLYDSVVTMALTPPHSGWIDWILIGTPRGGLLCIDCSSVFDPLEDVVAWFHRIARNRLPAEVKVDVEGCLMVLQARRVAGRPEWFEFHIEQRTYSHVKPAGNDTVFLCRARRQQVVAEFCRRFDQWRREDYSRSEWPSVKKLNIGALKRFARTGHQKLAKLKRKRRG